jgi:ElaB/YqjD/DUF883 family membrane-anchored ribosome-binding protein
MSNQKLSNEQKTSLGDNITGDAGEALQEVQHAMKDLTQRMKDELHNLSEVGKDVVSESKQKLVQEAERARIAAEHHIQRQPISSVFIALSAGAAAALAISWFVRSRSH